MGGSSSSWLFIELFTSMEGCREAGESEDATDEERETADEEGLEVV